MLIALGTLVAMDYFGVYGFGQNLAGSDHPVRRFEAARKSGGETARFQSPDQAGGSAI